MENLDFSTDYGIIVHNAIKAGTDYVKKNKIRSLVLGISGGVDSAVVAMLGRAICENAPETTLIGRSMPIDGNKEDEVSRANDVGKHYCHDFRVNNLDDGFLAMLQQIDGELWNKYRDDKPSLTHDEKVRAGNVKARVRMINLYHLAHKHRGLVLSTDNLTEYYLGFWTQNGDVGNLGLIQMLWKTEVFGIADAMGWPVNICAAAKPTDGLGVSDSDIDQLLPNWKLAMGSYRDAYKVVDDILIDYLFKKEKTYSPDHPVIQRHLATEFKRKVPVNIEREYLLRRHA